MKHWLSEQSIKRQGGCYDDFQETSEAEKRRTVSVIYSRYDASSWRKRFSQAQQMDDPLFFVRRFTEIADLEMLSEWKRKISGMFCFIGNMSLLVALGGFVSDQYKGLLGIPIAFGFYLGAVAIFKWAYNETL